MSPLYSLAFSGALMSVGGSNVHAATALSIHQLQERCGKLAADLFAKNYDHGKIPSEGYAFNYQAHYNARLNKCFFLVMSTVHRGTEILRGFELFDLVEHKQYGSFGIGPGGILDCRVQNVTCRSEDEWHELTKPYIEQ